MMYKKLIIADTETDGVTSTSTALSFSGLLCTVNLQTRELGIESAFNYYFAQEYDVPVDVVKIHHLTKQILDVRSNGRYFEDYKQELTPLLYMPDRYLCGHNISFDYRILKQTNQAYNGGFRIGYRGFVDTLKYTQKYVPKSYWPRSNNGPRLSACKEHIIYGEMGLIDDDILAILDNVPMYGFNEKSNLQHSSLFDALQVALILNYIIKLDGPSVINWEVAT